jgi:ribosomal protein L11 methyltransferase
MLLDAYNLKFEIKIIEQQNWNAEWEKNFSPIVIDNILAIKAPFHSEKFDTQDTIIIEPKMSFGTGHHATTHMMCKLISEYDFSESVVLDMGCGTGILAIYASMLGAAAVTAIDIDEWSYENTIENAERNNITNIATIRGDVKVIPDLKYDFIFANINLNVLKNDMSVYVKYMHKDSILLLSGFFAAEIPQIESVCKNNGLLFVKFIEMDSWTACVFNKI